MGGKMKTKSSMLNILSEIISKTILLCLGIIIPKLIIDNFGSEVNGLLSSINQLFVYLSVLEAGIGAASIQALYAPVSQGDQSAVNSILVATAKYYKKTGVYFLACVSVIAFVYPYLVESSISYFFIVLLILVSATSTAIDYFIQGKYTVLLTSDNKGYIITTVNAAASILANFVKILLIILGYNIILVQSSFIVVSIIKILIVKLYITKKYKFLNFSALPDYKAISQKSSVLVHQISAIIFNSSDVLIITFFCDFKVVSVYVIYNMIYSQTLSLISSFESGIVTSFGHLYEQNKCRFNRIFNFYEVYYLALLFALFTVVYILTLPFLRLYTSGITDVNYIDKWLPALFLSCKLLSAMRSSALVAINISGHFSKTKNSAIVESAINLITSLIGVYYMGIYGVLIGTIAAMLYRSIEMVLYSCKNILYRKWWIPIKRWLINLGILVSILTIIKNISFTPSNYLEFIVEALVLTCMIGLIYFSIVTIIEKDARNTLGEFTRAFIKAIKNYNLKYRK